MLKKAMAEMSPISQWVAPMARAKAARNGPTKNEFIAVVQMPSKIIERVLLGEVPMRVMSRIRISYAARPRGLTERPNSRSLASNLSPRSFIVANHPGETFGFAGSLGRAFRMRLQNTDASSSSATVSYHPSAPRDKAHSPDQGCTGEGLGSLERNSDPICGIPASYAARPHSPTERRFLAASACRGQAHCNHRHAVSTVPPGLLSPSLLTR